MKINALTLRDLEYVVAVADHGHFGKAAHASHISQPALSAQIKKVENLLGAVLFERTQRRVMITDQGRQIADQARIVLEEAGKLGVIARTDQSHLAGPLRLGAMVTLGPYYWPHVLAPLRKAFPKLELQLREGLTQALVESLRSGELDAILVSPTFVDPVIVQMPLFFEPFVLAAPAQHPLLKSKELKSLQLRANEMVLLEDGHCLKDQTLETCPTNRRGNIRQFHATSLETLRHLVASGLGYTLMPLLAVHDDPKLSRLVEYRPFDGKPLGRQIVLATRKRSSRFEEMELLADFLRKHTPSGV